MLIEPERQPDNQKTDDQHDENRRAITRIGKTVIQSACAAGGFYRQKTIEKAPVAAARAAALQAHLDRVDRGELAA